MLESETKVIEKLLGRAVNHLLDLRIDHVGLLFTAFHNFMRPCGLVAVNAERANDVVGEESSPTFCTVTADGIVYINMVPRNLLPVYLQTIV